MSMRRGWRFLRGGVGGWCRLQHSSAACRPINKLLIANRGEIACRVMRTARRLGVKTVAVYSDPDRNSMHVAMADEAYRLGPAASQESYLRGDKILEVAMSSGAQAVHPGYGFLSENAEFADECLKAGVVFVGPPASAIRDMGIKSTSKAIMSEASVPVVGGYHGEEQTDERLAAEAHRIGFPVMIKAGMRIAMKPEEFQEQLESARREAMKSFGDDVMLIEKFVERPRHVEVQVFGDHHGNYVYLFERDCSVQRRHQKIIEEAPAIVGLNTNVDFLLTLATHPSFQAGDVSTDFIPDHYDELFPPLAASKKLLCQAALAQVLEEEQEGVRAVAASQDPTSPFGPSASPRINHTLIRTLPFTCEGKEEEVRVEYLGDSKYRMSVGGESFAVSGSLVCDNGVRHLSASVGDSVSRVNVVLDGRDIHLFTQVSVPAPKFESELGHVAGASGGAVAPMPGVVEKVFVSAGQTVEAGDPLVVMIAMKMEYVIKASSPGVVEKVLFEPGQSVARNTPLVKLKEAEE
ncbi:Methylcrotonoyl-CoA carboxylase subunit alpha, mitochondrial [Portunus trituberculatus]|uniref:Methylcrotonoyl-CoA carboxylase subunit alpha, mitochondrial n=1 Tax=Portunus trituberculatus TaxID=210409 RepID=A0A5B7CYN9_PORTR|nr:Methylcrotonoyl-CoA carboxylase subunit alpha, mitochondrial [Portunus trituberculatus]